MPGKAGAGDALAALAALPVKNGVQDVRWLRIIAAVVGTLVLLAAATMAALFWLTLPGGDLNQATPGLPRRSASTSTPTASAHPRAERN